MKSNVDLTLNRDFDIKNNNVIYKFSNKILNPNKVYSLSDLYNKVFKKGYPWNCINTLRKTLNSEQLFLTGSKNDRVEKRKAIDYENECECCGKDLTKIPWDNHYKLCKKCDELLSDNLQHSLWIRILKNK